MTEKATPDHLMLRQDIQRELYLDTRLAETGLPFDGASLAQGVGEVGIAGFYLHHGMRHSSPPKGFRPLADQATDIVAKTLERHNRDARFTDPPQDAAYYILSHTDLMSVTSITSEIVRKWARTLWTKEGTLLLPDRRAYKYRSGQLTDEEMAREAHIKAVIVEVGAAVLEVGAHLSYDISSKRNQRMMCGVLLGRGPEFLRKWLSQDILTTWLETTGQQEKADEWKAFATKSMLLCTLQHNILNPLDALQRMKHAHDSLSTAALVARTGWTAERVDQEFPSGTRKHIATRSDVESSVNTMVDRLNAVSIESICAYTGWTAKQAATVFGSVERRNIAIERRDPVKDAVMAIAKAHDFLADSQNIAQVLNKPIAEVEERFTPTIRRRIVKQARPPRPAKDDQDGTSQTVDELAGVKDIIKDVDERLDLLRSPEKLSKLLGWTPHQTSERILGATIDYFATNGKDFTATVQKFCRTLASLDDAHLAKLLGITEQLANERISWSVRQRCVIDHGTELHKSMIAWWEGKKQIGSSKRLILHI